MIYVRHKDPLLTLAYSLLNNRDLAEDVVQDVFVAFAKSMKDISLSCHLRGYLSVSVCNRVRDLIRAKVRQKNKAQQIMPEEKAVSAPDDQLVRQETMQQLRQALQLVPLEQREVLVLRTQAGLTFKDIAKLQGISVNTVQGRYRYGIEKLRSAMNAEEKP